MAKNEANIKFTADCKEFNAQIDKASSTITVLKSELKLNEQQMKATGETVEGLEKSHSLLESQLAASQDKIAALSGKLDAAIQNFGEGSNEVDKWRTVLLNAQTAEEKLKQEIAVCADKLEEHRKAADNADTATDDLEESVNQSAEAAENASESFTIFKGAMADLVADGISAVISGLSEVTAETFSMANDIDSATNTFIAKTGASADSAEDFEDVMTSIYSNNYGESFDDIAESAATVKTTLGDIDGAELENATTSALILRDTFDMDVSESVRAVNSLMDQFGITSDEAYNLIAQGAQKGLNQNGDLMDVVNEYSVQFARAGLSADDMFNMLANGVDAGTWSVDKLGDAFKEFNIRASDGTVAEALNDNAEALGMTTQEAKALGDEIKNGNTEAYGTLLDKLKEVDDETQRYQLGVEMFGTMWEDLGEDAVMALFNTQGEISKTNDALAEINGIKYNDLGSALEGVSRELKTSIAGVLNDEVLPAVGEFVSGVDWGAVGESIGSAVGTVVDVMLNLVDATMQAVSWMKEHKGVMVAIAAVIAIVTTAITAYNVVQGIKAAMDAAQVTTIWGLVAAHIAQAAAAIAAIAPYILAVAIIAGVIAIIVLLIKYWDEIPVWIAKAWEAIKAILIQWGTWIYENVIQPIGQFFSGVWNSIVSVCSAVWEWIKQVILSAWEGIKTGVSTAIQAVSSVISSVWNTIKSVTSTVWNAVKSFVSTVWNGIKTAVSTAVTAVKTKVTQIWNSIKTATSTAFNAVKSTVSNIWNGIKTAISTAITTAWNAITLYVGNIKTTAITSFNVIKSTVSRIWNGIKEAISTPIEAAKEKVRSVIDAIKGFFDFSFSWPKISMPKFSITPAGWKVGDLLKGSIPKLGITWNAEGGILTKPTIFGMNGNNFLGGGEAGAEAILPIDKLEGYVVNAIQKTVNTVNLNALADAIEDLANRPVSMSVNGREFMVATAGDGDSVNGMRTTLKARGLVFE